MTRQPHPLLERLLRKVGATANAVPSLDSWRTLLELVGRTYHDGDQDRYTAERAMDISSREMQALYQELEQRTARELAAIRESEERHRLLFDGNPLPIWVLDAETLRFLAVNDAMSHTYGYSRDELLAVNASELKHPDDMAGLVREIDAAPSNAIRRVGVRRHRRKDGRILDVDITVHAITFAGRRAVLAIALDITRARRLEEDLRQAQKMEAIGQLAGGIAHDFNNILAVILGNAELTLDTLGEGHPAAPDIVEIKDAAARAAALTRQLLTFSRKQKRAPRPVALGSVVNGIETMLTRIVGEDIAMSATSAPDLGTIEADPGELEQVLMNLVVNARDAMSSGGRLRIETSNAVVDEAQAPELGLEPGRYIVLAVSDTGCGMTEEVRTRIFEPFFTTKDVDKGTGLGLSTVFGIVKQSGGGITVSSEPGRGTTFTAYWPRIDAVAAKEASPRFVPVRGSGTVLVVEDDRQVRAVLRRYLTSWGFTLLEAPNGTTALELMRGHPGPIDLLLTDLVMPGLDGRSLSQQVLVEKPRTRVIFMSGYTEHAALKHAALGPDDHFVQKPFSAQDLSDTIQRALGQARPRPRTGHPPAPRIGE